MTNNHTIRQVGRSTYDVDNRVFLTEGRSQKLSLIKHQLFTCLLDNKNKLVAKEKLLVEAYGDEQKDINNLYAQMRQLKDIIHCDANLQIENKYARGYKLIESAVKK
jgi:DNA-binding response OmpR family regulator